MRVRVLIQVVYIPILLLTPNYEQIIYSILELNTSGISKYSDANNISSIGTDIKKGVLVGGNLGLGLDLGLTYYPKSNILLKKILFLRKSVIVNLRFLMFSIKVQLEPNYL